MNTPQRPQHNIIINAVQKRDHISPVKGDTEEILKTLNSSNDGL